VAHHVRVLQLTTEVPMSAISIPSPVTQLFRWLVMLSALTLAACGGGAGGLSGAAGPPVPAPQLAVGDHWQYRIVDNLRRGALTMLDAEVTAINNGIASLRLVYTDAQGATTERTEEINAQGWLVVGTLKQENTRRFPEPIELFNFPLTSGTTWRQTVNTTSPETGLRAQILVFGTIQGQSQVSVPAGSFTAVYLYRILQLDDEQFWRTRTTRRDSVWYTAENKAAAREMREAQYVENGGMDVAPIRTEATVRELVSFRAGRG